MGQIVTPLCFGFDPNSPDTLPWARLTADRYPTPSTLRHFVILYYQLVTTCFLRCICYLGHLGGGGVTSDYWAYIHYTKKLRGYFDFSRCFVLFRELALMIVFKSRYWQIFLLLCVRYMKFKLDPIWCNLSYWVLWTSVRSPCKILCTSSGARSFEVVRFLHWKLEFHVFCGHVIGRVTLYLATFPYRCMLLCFSLAILLNLYTPYRK